MNNRKTRLEAISRKDGQRKEMPRISTPISARAFKRAFLALLLLSGAGAWPSSWPCAAETYPNRQIELVVPFVAGGTTDTVARLISQRLTDSWSFPPIVHKRPRRGPTTR